MLDRFDSSDQLVPCTTAETRMPEYSSTEEEASDCEPVQLQPFIHQVGGHSCVLRFNETTLCKPLITREHHFYESIPPELQEFIPDYRGIVEVELQEDNDGSMTLIGHPIQSENQERKKLRSSRSSPKGFERCNSPTSSGSDAENSQSPILKPRTGNKNTGSANDSYSVRLLRSGSIEVNAQTDTVFHSPDHKSGQKSAGLNPWSLKCHKRQLAKMRTDNQDSNLRKFILLENVAAKFKYPCILDLKMGTRQHGDDAPEAKKDSQMRKCASTTSSAVGVRLIGMQVYQTNSEQFVCQNKYYGRRLTVDGFKEALEMFLNNGANLRLELLDPILLRLQQLYKTVLKQESFRFYSSSLLIMYGGNDRSHTSDVHQNQGSSSITHGLSSDMKVDHHTDNCSSPRLNDSSDVSHDDGCLVDVRMIDFAHSTHQGFRGDEAHKGVDQGYLFGLENLIMIFEDIKKRYCDHQSDVV